MNIREALLEIQNTLRAYTRRDELGRYCIPPAQQRPILLMGPPGIGKTAILAQAAEAAGVGLVAYTMTHHTRQSAIGLPHIQTRTYRGRQAEVTVYTLSEIVAAVYDCIERTGKDTGILFIDEINCVSETLAPTMLQLLQNKTFGNHALPEGWLLVAAGNPPEYNRSVREFDVVTLDRVRQIDVEPELDVWLDYARSRRVHGAILSFLGLRADAFYRVERTPEGPNFVTARGWEDLSALLRSYEELEISVGAAQIGQYLRCAEIARAFAGFYQLYRKYGESYGIPEILDGTALDRPERVARAREADFDERFAVVNQALDCLSGHLARYVRTDRRVVSLHQALGDFQIFKGGLDEFLRGRRHALAVKREKGLLPQAQEETETWVLRRLEDYELELKAGHSQDFARLKALFTVETAERAALVEAVQCRLERAYAFLRDAFGDGRELLLFTTALTHLDSAMDFITRHGCPPYLEAAGKLLYQEFEPALREACGALLGQ